MTNHKQIYIDVIQRLGGVNQAAKALGVAQPSVSGWKLGIRRMSAKSALDVRDLLGDDPLPLSDDLKNMIGLIGDRMDPEDVFEARKLKQWAKKQGYTKKVDTR